MGGAGNGPYRGIVVAPYLHQHLQPHDPLEGQDEEGGQRETLAHLVLLQLGQDPPETSVFLSGGGEKRKEGRVSLLLYILQIPQDYKGGDQHQQKKPRLYHRYRRSLEVGGVTPSSTRISQSYSVIGDHQGTPPILPSPPPHNWSIQDHQTLFPRGGGGTLTAAVGRSVPGRPGW